MIKKGRKKILTDEAVITENNVVGVLNDALSCYRENSSDIDFLYNYYKGEQPILNRVKTIRPEICNKIVENRAYEIVEFKTGYLCGEPIQYVSRGSTDDISGGISKLNDYMLLSGKAARDKELTEWAYICGLGYRMIMPNSKYILSSIVPKLKNQTTGFAEDESPFNIYTLDPRNAFVVYYSGLGEYPVMGVKYVVKKDYSVIFSVYTPTQYFELESSSASSAGRITKVEPNVLGMIPIIEYPMNNARLGAFEVVLPLLDAINLVQSNRLDGIEQFIQSLVVLVNAEIEDGKESAIRNAGLISLKTFGDLKQDIKIISEQLDQAQTQVLIDYMYQTVLNIVGMPNRNGGNSTSDTGSAVIMRDGWESAEARAKSAELMIKEPERNYLLKAALRIMRDTVGTPLKLSDIEIKFTRRNYENILSKSQVLTSMLANDKIAPILAFTHCGLFSDPEDAAKMSAEHHANVLAKASATEKESQTKEGVAIA